MKDFIRKAAMLSVAALIGVTACADLDVVNPNQPDAERALQSPGDVETLIAGSYRQWWLGTQHEQSGGPIMANQSFMITSWPANYGMFFYSQLPSVAIVNDPTHEFYDFITGYSWTQFYRAASAVAQGFQALEDPDIAGELNENRARAYGRFVQGLAHGSLALLYDEAWILDENTEVVDDAGLPLPLETVPYPQVMDVALAFLDEAIALATGASWETPIPSSWMSVNVSPAQLVRLAHSFKAEFRANVARTPEERAAVDWAGVVADVQAGITDDFTMSLQYLLNPWWTRMGAQFSDPTTGWAQVSYFVDGMADQSGMYQDWMSYPAEEKQPTFSNGDARLIHTPDLRFPQGADEAEQRENPGMAHRVSGSPHIIVGPLSWGQPARGSHRWSYYRRAVTDFHRASGSTPSDWPVLTLTGQRMLVAEAAFHGVGTLDGAADLINDTRTAAGLSPTDAGGTNADCVPRLWDGECGDLFEMLKWEKRMETAFFGLHSVPWYFDGRGWGDLYIGTPLQRPVPCQEREIIEGVQPGSPGCDTYGGVGGAFASPGSSYGYPHEG